MNRIYILILGLILSFLACQEDKVEPDLFGTLTGEVVFEEDGLPAPNVSISTSPSSSTLLTFGNGTFEFESIKVGTYTVRAELTGFLTSSESITISENQTTTVVLKLSPSLGGNSSPSAAFSPFPNDAAIDQPLTMEFSWEATDPDDDELTFDVYLFDADMQNEALIGESLTETKLQVDDLRYGSTYFWQVVVSDGEADPVFSEVWQFSTSPFPNHSFVFSKIENSVYEIFSGGVANEFYQLTTNGSNYRPRFSPLGNRIAYINSNYPENRLFVMNRDGSDQTLVETAFPIESDYKLQMNFTWSPDGTQLLYMRGNRLYKVNIDGTGPTLFYELMTNEEFVEVDWTGAGNKVAARTVGDLPFQSRILLFQDNGTFLQEVIPDVPGNIGGPAFSIDGNSILYTRDTTGFEMPDGRQLESHIFLKNLTTGLEKDLSFDKPDGFNDLEPRFSPNGALIIFTHTNNFPNSKKDIYIMTSQGEGRGKLFENSEMPDWWN